MAYRCRIEGLLAMTIFAAGMLSESCTSACSCDFSGPQLDCVGFVPCTSAVDGECYCRVRNSVELQFGQCMELTVDVTNSSAALSCMWYANNSRQFRNDPSDFFEVRGDRNQTLTFRREFSEFYFTSLITFNCTDGEAQSSVVYQMTFNHIPNCKEYDQRQTPYIVFPKEQVNATVIAGSSLTLGPIVVKNLNVDNIYALGSWCLYSDGVMKCCNFDLEPVLDRTGAALISSCVGGLEEWRLLRSLDCESGLVEYSLFKAGVRVNDSGQYVYTVTSDIGYMFNYTMDVRVNRVSILSSLPVSPEIATVISTFTTLLIVIPVAVLIIVLVGSIVASWSRKAQRKEVFLREAVAECEAVGPVQMAVNNDGDDQPRRLTSSSVYLDLGESVFAEEV